MKEELFARCEHLLRERAAGLLCEPPEVDPGGFVANPFDNLRAHGWGVTLSAGDIVFLQEFESQNRDSEHSDQERLESILCGHGGAGYRSSPSEQTKFVKFCEEHHW